MCLMMIRKIFVDILFRIVWIVAQLLHNRKTDLIGALDVLQLCLVLDGPWNRRCREFAVHPFSSAYAKGPENSSVNQAARPSRGLSRGVRVCGGAGISDGKPC